MKLSRFNVWNIVPNFTEKSWKIWFGRFWFGTPLSQTEQGTAILGVIEAHRTRRPWSKARHPTHTGALRRGGALNTWSCGSGASGVNCIVFCTYITQMISDSCRSLVSSDMIWYDLHSISFYPTTNFGFKFQACRCRKLWWKGSTDSVTEIPRPGPCNSCLPGLQPSQVTVDKYMLDSSAIHWHTD